MGSYTALVLQAELNDTGLEVIHRLIQARGNEDPNAWKVALEPLGPGRWAAWPDLWRSSFIPFHLRSMDTEAETFLGEMGWTTGLDGNTWTIACDLKDQGDINIFLEFVMCYLIKTELTAYTRNEDDPEDWGWEKTWVEPKRIRRRREEA